MSWDGRAAGSLWSVTAYLAGRAVWGGYALTGAPRAVFALPVSVAAAGRRCLKVRLDAAGAFAYMAGPEVVVVVAEQCADLAVEIVDDVLPGCG